MDSKYLTSGARLGIGAGRAAHNSWMSALVNYGFPGAFLYTLLYLWGGRALLRLRRMTRDDAEMGTYVAAAAASLAVVAVAGQFSNYVYAEVQFWMFAIVAAMYVLVLERQKDSAAAESVLQSPINRESFQTSTNPVPRANDGTIAHNPQ